MIEPQQVGSFAEVIDILDKKAKLTSGTVILTDYDNTLVSFHDQKMHWLAFRPEEVPSDTVALINRITAAGTKVCVTTNRPGTGFKIIQWLAKKLGNYPVFPDSLTELGVTVFGAGDDFLTKRYKKTDEAVYDVRSWLLHSVEAGGAGLPEQGTGGTLVCVGDRPADVTFFTEVAESVLAANPETTVETFKLPGFTVEDDPASVDTLGERIKRLLIRFLP